MKMIFLFVPDILLYKSTIPKYGVAFRIAKTVDIVLATYINEQSVKTQLQT
jgi:hypothetical protein